MTRRRDTLARIQLIASIASSIAVPLLIAVFGWVVQARISEEGAKKDYVQIAVGILTDTATKGDEGLRKWAVAVLDKTAPVAFSEEIRTKLEKGELAITRFYFPVPAQELMEPPLQLVPLPNKDKVTNGDLLKNISENYYRFKVNAVRQEALQQWIHEVSAIVNKRDKATKSTADSGK